MSRMRPKVACQAACQAFACFMHKTIYFGISAKTYSVPRSSGRALRGSASVPNANVPSPSLHGCEDECRLLVRRGHYHVIRSYLQAILLRPRLFGGVSSTSSLARLVEGQERLQIMFCTNLPQEEHIGITQLNVINRTSSSPKSASRAF